MSAPLEIEQYRETEPLLSLAFSISKTLGPYDIAKYTCSNNGKHVATQIYIVKVSPH